MTEPPWQDRFGNNDDSGEPLDWEGGAESSGDEIDLSIPGTIAAMVKHLGSVSACEMLEHLPALERGSPELVQVLELLRELRRQRVLSNAGYFFVVATIMEFNEHLAPADDPGFAGVALACSHRASEDEARWNAKGGVVMLWDHAWMSPDLVRLKGELVYIMRMALVDWLRELGEYEMAFLAESEPGMYERRRLAGMTEILGATFVSLRHCPGNDSINGYLDPRC